MPEPFFIPASFFLFRIPTWPKEKAELVFVQDHEVESLIHLYDTSEQLREAIAVASPSLHESLQKRTGTNLKQAATSLSHYITRMSTRATPFGLFACVSTGSWGKDTHLFFDPSRLRKRARCDMEWIYSMIQKVYQEDKFFISLSVRTNPLAQLSGERYHLNYTRHIEKGFSQKVFSIRTTKLTRYILNFAREPIEIHLLWQKIQKMIPALDQDKTLGVIRELLSQQFLLPAILPSLLDVSPFESLLEHLPSFLHVRDIANEIHAYNRLLPGKGEIALKNLQKNMSTIVSSKTYLQVDTAYDQENATLSKDVATELTEALTVLWKIAAAQSKQSSLVAYHEKFIEKYGTHRTVPLLELLDEEKGLGTFENHVKTPSSKSNSQWEKWLNQQWQECIYQRKKEWILTKEALDQFLLTPQQKHLSPQEGVPSLDVFCKIFANSKKDIDAGNFLILLSETTSEGGSAMGRFLDMLGEKTQTELSEFFRLEEQLEPHALFVELSYWPASVRSANVAIQPCLRSYRLDTEAKQWQKGSLSLQDIYVGATSSRFYMTLKEGGSEILTRAGNLFNMTYAPLPIKFMRYVTLSQFRSLFAFSWGDMRETAAFLPRVRFQKTILSPAQWNIDAQLFMNEPLEKIPSLFTSWADQWEVPERFLLTQEDLQLLLNRQHLGHLQEIANQLKQGKSLRLVEYIEKAWIKGEEGHHLCEICVPFLKNPLYASKEKKIHPPSYHPIAYEERAKLLGSNWLFVKLYLTEEKNDEFLVRHLHPFAEQLRHQARILQWFIVRYRDPDSHVRFRMNLSHLEHYPEILSLLEIAMRQWLERGLIRDVIFATYEREIERYGGPLLIDAAEAVFCHDTLATLSILQLLLTKQINCHESILHPLCIIRFLRDFGLNEEEMLFILKEEEDQSELKGFRTYKNPLITFAKAMNEINDNSTQPEMIALNTASRWRSQVMQDYGNQAQNLDKEKLYSIYDSMLHMHCNRLGCLGKAETRARLYARQLLLHMKYLLPSFTS